MRSVLLVAVAMVGGLAVAGIRDLPEYRATPFYAAGAESVNHDRLNLWPLVYVNGDTGSAIVNLFSYSPEHFALHPLYSYYRRSGNGGSTMNILGPFSHFDSRNSSGWIFPLWYFRHGGADAYSALLPLATWGDGYFYSLLYGQDDDGCYLPWLLTEFDCDKGRVLSPLYCNTDKLMVVPPLLSWYRHGQQEFYSLPYCQGPDWFSVPVLLSGRTARGTFLSPLYCSGEDSVWIPPLLSGYGFKDGEFYSPLYSWGKDWSLILPLLTYVDEKGFEVFPLFSWKYDGSWGSPILLTFGGSDNMVSAPLLSRWKRQPSGNESTDILLGLAYHNRFACSKKGMDFGTTTWECLPALSFGKQVENQKSHDEYQALLLGSYYHRRIVRKGEEYERHSVLWKFWDWQERNGNSSLDCFPGISYDRGSDGSSSFSLLWRLYRYQTDAKGARKLDLFYIPLIRD